MLREDHTTKGYIPMNNPRPTRYYEVSQDRMIGRCYALPRDARITDKRTETQTLRGALRVARKWAREYGARVRVEFTTYDPMRGRNERLHLADVVTDALDRVWVDVSPQAAKAGLL